MGIELVGIKERLIGLLAENENTQKIRELLSDPEIKIQSHEKKEVSILVLYLLTQGLIKIDAASELGKFLSDYNLMNTTKKLVEQYPNPTGLLDYLKDYLSEKPERTKKL
ncbi:MAG: hypothetical protein A3F12_04100 [Gammaproteobacteria bacterium RIFCSPHIGHO2_12_FULL_38_14]|nr:MAG: hypothetical protein A3F12_04100 [Gammaproteobacteria bacterium RIFCSPHIGHO2_12_FULL_38_14]